MSATLETVLLVVSSDEHIGCKTGLCVPKLQLDDGDTYIANKGQRWIWRNWLNFWDYVKERKKVESAKVLTVFNGDGPDRNWHSAAQQFTMNPNDLLNASREVYRPAIAVSDIHFRCRGTEAHEGRSAWLAERLAKETGAEQDEKTGRHSWWYVPLEIQGLLGYTYHHPETVGYRPWTQKAAAVRQSEIVSSNFSKRKKRSERVPPDFIVYGHVHYWADSGIDTFPRVIYNYGWKLPDAYIHRRGGGIVPRPVGATIITIRNGRIADIEPVSYEIGLKKPWRENDRGKQ